MEPQKLQSWQASKHSDAGFLGVSPEMEIQQVSRSLQASGSRAVLPNPEKQEQNGPMYPPGVSLSLDIRQKHMLPPGALEGAALVYHHLVTLSPRQWPTQFRVSERGLSPPAPG